MKTALIIVGGLLVGVLIGWILIGNELVMTAFFAPKFEQVRRNTFEQSKAYRQGMIQELQNMQFQYVRADSAAKQALASIILHRVADFPESDMPADLASFIRSLRSGVVYRRAY
jgi:hypothetical protein